jgi:hypothetical protein
MPKLSAVDRHPDRDAILRDIALGMPLRKVAAKWSVPTDSCFRAKRKMPKELARSLRNILVPDAAEAERVRVTEERAIVPTLQTQRVRLLLMQDQAVEAGNIGLAASIAGQITKNVEQTAKIVGAMAPTRHEHVSVTVSPEYVAFRSAILQSVGKRRSRGDRQRHSPTNCDRASFVQRAPC